MALAFGVQALGIDAAWVHFEHFAQSAHRGIGPVTEQLRCTLPGRLGKVHRGLFQDVTFLRDVIELGLQAPHLFGLGIDDLALRLGYAIALRPGVQTVDAYPEPCRYFARRVTALRHLLDRCNLGIPLCTAFHSYLLLVLEIMAQECLR